MFCPKCGKQLSEDAKFCGGCGSPVQPSVKISPVTPTPVNSSNMAPVIPPPANQTNLPSDMEMAENTREEERRNRKLTIILFVVLAVLILVAAGMAIYYFKVLRSSENNSMADRIEEMDAGEGVEEPGTDAAEGAEQADQTEASQEAEEPEGVVSDTNEVVGETILENIPKALYSYPFNEELGGARVVVRDEPETEPEEADLEPQYARGVDGEAVYLDGTYGIKLDDVERVGESYTVAFWMKADRVCDWSPFIHIGHDPLEPNKRVRLWLAQKTDGVSVAPIISSEKVETEDSVEIRPEDSMPNRIEPNVWYHIAFTVDASRQGSQSGRVLGTLYVAGQRIGEGDVIPDTMNVDDFDVFLGINCWDELYPVAFDDVKIWDQVLDGGQIQELYQAYE